MAKRKASEKVLRRKIIERDWDEIEKIAMGLQSGRLEAFEVYGVTLARLIKNAAQTDMYMAVLFEVLPTAAQKKMLADARIKQSLTVISILKLLRAKTKRPTAARKGGDGRVRGR